AGMPNADPDTDKIIADMSADRAQAVVAGISPAGFHPHFARWQIQLVVKHDDVGEVDFEKPRCLAHGPATFIHVRHWLEQQYALAADGAFRHLTLKPATPG